MRDDINCTELCARALELAQTWESHGSALWIGTIAGFIAIGTAVGTKLMKEAREQGEDQQNRLQDGMFLYRHKDKIATGTAAFIGAIPAISSSIVAFHSKR